MNGLLRGLVVFSFSFAGIFLVSCGGGNNSLPSTAAPDTKPPYILATSPTPGQKNVGTVTFLDIQFNEVVSHYRADNFIIKSYSGNTLNNTPITLNSTDFFFNETDNILSVNLNNKLTLNTKYQITIQNVKDESNNIMPNQCRWEFATVDYIDFVSSDIVMDCGKPQSASDSAMPTITISPGNTSVGIDTSTDINVAFNKAMNAATLQNNIKLYKVVGTTPEEVTPSPYDYYYDPIKHAVNYTASQIPALLTQQHYNIVVTSGDQGILDYNGNKLDADETISFETRLNDNKPADTTPPEVVTVNPAKNQTAVDIATNIGIAFNETMNSLLLQSNIMLERFENGQYLIVSPFPFSFGINDSKNTIIFTPISSPALLSGTQYRVTIKGGVNGVTDSVGIPMVDDFVFMFTTLAITPILT